MIRIPFIKIWMTRGGGMKWVVALDEATGRRTGPFSFFHHMCFSIVMGKISSFFKQQSGRKNEAK